MHQGTWPLCTYIYIYICNNNNSSHQSTGRLFADPFLFIHSGLFEVKPTEGILNFKYVPETIFDLLSNSGLSETEDWIKYNGVLLKDDAASDTHRRSRALAVNILIPFYCGNKYLLFDRLWRVCSWDSFVNIQLESIGFWIEIQIILSFKLQVSRKSKQNYSFL